MSYLLVFGPIYIVRYFISVLSFFISIYYFWVSYNRITNLYTTNMRKKYFTPEVDIVHLTIEKAFLDSSSLDGLGADITWSGDIADFDSIFNIF